MKTKNRLDAPKHPIRVAALRTGLSPDLLRAWEKRYGVVEPSRSEGGQRLYTDEDVERLALLGHAVEHGRAISQVAHLPNNSLAQLIQDDQVHSDLARRTSPALTTKPEVSTKPSLDRAFQAVERMDAEELDHALQRGLLELTADQWIEGVITPLMKRVGDAWHAGRLGPAAEHLATVIVRRHLGSLLGSLRTTDNGAPLMLTATPASEIHEIGAMVAAAAGAAEGWRSIYLGADLPAIEIAQAVDKLGARAVALSLTYPGDPSLVRAELIRLTELLPPEVHLFVGGSAAAAIAPGGSFVEFIESSDALRERLASLNKA